MGGLNANIEYIERVSGAINVTIHGPKALTMCGEGAGR